MRIAERGCYRIHCHNCGKALRYFDTYEQAKAGDRRLFNTR